MIYDNTSQLYLFFILFFSSLWTCRFWASTLTLMIMEECWLAGQKIRTWKTQLFKILYFSKYTVSIQGFSFPEFDSDLVVNMKQKRFKKIAWIQSLNLQWKFKLLAGKFTWGNKAKHCWVMSTNFLTSPAMFWPIISSKLFLPII